MNIGEKLEIILKKKGKRPATLANEIGVNKTTIYSIIRRNNKKVDYSIIEKIAENLGISVDYFFSDELQETEYKGVLPITTKKIPLLGEIACGEPIYAQEDHSYSITVDDSINADFALRCKGDSMIGARIYDGDVVFIRRQEFVDDGTIAAVVIDDEATLKRVYHLADGRIELRAANDRYAPILIGGNDETRNFKVLGKAVACQFKIA